MDLSGPGINVKLKERKKEDGKTQCMTGYWSIGKNMECIQFAIALEKCWNGWCKPKKTPTM